MFLMLFPFNRKLRMTGTISRHFGTILLSLKDSTVSHGFVPNHPVYHKIKLRCGPDYCTDRGPKLVLVWGCQRSGVLRLELGKQR